MATGYGINWWTSTTKEDTNLIFVQQITEIGVSNVLGTHEAEEGH